jgi:putative aldouronate transport system substrate-binding protein
MSKMKKGMSLLLVMLFAFTMVLAGCGAKDTAGADATKEAATPTPAATEEKKEEAPASNVPKDEVTLTMYLVGNGQEPDTDAVLAKINEYMKDKLNVKLNLQVFGWGDDYNQKVNTALASGEPIDIVFTAAWAANYRVNAASGYFLQLNDLLNKYPKVKEVVGEDFLNGSAIDGKNFAVPCNKEKVHNWGFLLMKSIVDKLQIDISTIKKTEDMEPIWDKVLASEKGMTPFMSTGESAFLQDWDFISDDDVPGALYPDNRDTKIINNLLAPESIAEYKKMREYYKKGYVHPDAVTMKNGVELMKTGKFFSSISSLKPGKDAEMTQSTGVEWVQVDITPVVMTNRETTGSLLAIPAGSKNAERAFQFIEMLYTDEFLVNTLVYGIEGTHYTKVSDKVVKLTDNKGYRAGNGWRFGNQFNNYLLDTEDPQKWDKFLEFNKKGLPLTSLGFMFDKTPVENQVSAVKAVTEKYMKSLRTGSVEPDPTVAKLTEELKAAGTDEIIAEMQKQYDAWLVKTGKKK